MSSGVVVSVTPKSQGSTVASTVTTATTVVSVVDASDFAEDFTTDRFVVFGESLTPKRYVAVQNDEDAGQQSITLAGPYGEDTAAEVGLPVTLWDPTLNGADKRSQQFFAEVRLDEQPVDASPVPAVIPHGLIPLSGAYSLEGAQVSLEVDDGEVRLDQVHARPPTLTSSVIQTPNAIGALFADYAWASGGFTTILPFATLGVTGVSYDNQTGLWTFLESGIYSVVLTATFAANASGFRGARIVIHPLSGAPFNGGTVKVLPVDAEMPLQVIEQRFFAAGEAVSMQARQTSGASLMLMGSVLAGSLDRPTSVSIVRVAST